MRVGLFVTCLVDLIRPRIGFCTVRLLERAGADVVVPESQTCCGQPGYNSGDLDAARALGRKLLEEFRDCEYVVVPSGSCAGMIRHHYPHLFAGQPDAVAFQALAERTFELTDFLVNVAKLENPPGTFHGSITYHDSCAGLRELGIKRQPRALLARLAGLELREMTESETCCGFGGTFSVKFGDISARMADKKCDRVADTGATTLVAGDLGCLLNLEGRLRRRGDHQTRVLHIAEVLAGDVPGRTSSAGDRTARAADVEGSP
jgi:L-lactate dehydrogenase complex protein LldE